MSAITEKDVLYNDDEETAEVEFDSKGNVPVPTYGSIPKRKGKQWKVASTSMQSAAPAAIVPVLKINLTDHF